MTANWVAVASRKELARRRKLRVELDGLAIALFEAAGRVYAFADACVHQDRSLVKGTLLHGKVICPGHQWQFDLETGYEESQGRCQPTYAVRVDDDTVYVDPTARMSPVTAGEEANA
ncbi:Rieske (2Fe-2S) protein [Mycolicibacterium smegmatis]|uniref:Rieske (2Fe-2S) region n=3 Tax=Mycolicibacterium smegmatis TaxID=1772 RepID=I7G426_MYCS2|nr:Rieske (2Fe-2S) protein [Mycolicibacterium smegmatis]ABK73400.1 Rieske [2Fe-2S] domain protein [Mycolicibacterium smegmatis MC2 155]AFP37896.1 Rieske (2Fe-2S) region [Mycolicibacterium smegmatis MC2 155]AIU06694.1 dioxygenase [Mycolicibacterium smegmatis MC2 155]AIU13319.1 dioxygenase [Mycolicibacterium smegmatis]AIU19943.1 dioxygenase [Mycolicibacterium smegmatis]